MRQATATPFCDPTGVKMSQDYAFPIGKVAIMSYTHIFAL